MFNQNNCVLKCLTVFNHIYVYLAMFSLDDCFKPKQFKVIMFKVMFGLT
jgi:hypothetical protein